MEVTGEVSVVAVPILVEDLPFGSLLVGTSNTEGFSALHLRFFEQLVASVKTSLKLFRVDRERQRAREEREATLRDLNATLEDAIKTLSEAMVARDPYTVGHEQRVADIAMHIAKRMGFDDQRAHVVYLAALIHDIGKIKVPIELLTKPTPLRPEEFAIIKEHAAASFEILSKINWPWPLATIAGQHHEKMDGSGYPHGLKGDQILQEARILSVADILESVMAPRPYRGGLGAARAIQIITAGRGTALCPECVDTALALFAENPNWVEELGR